MQPTIITTAASNGRRNLHRIFATGLVVAPLLLAACVELDDAESLDEESAELAADTTIDEGALLEAPETAPAAASLPPGCKAYASTPTIEGFNIEGGGNWYDCPATSRFRVFLKRHRSWWPDVTLAEGSGTGSSGWLRLFKSCRYRGGPTYVYSEIRHESSGWKAQSQRLSIPCVF
jgi:hypothetical protein